ncbi:MAG: hypothetical protein AAGJ80_00800 [Cyanobacteria bacterium J06553_1]
MSTRDPATRDVTSAVCRMCKQFGREDNRRDDDSKALKRKRTVCVKYYSRPWRADNIKRHLELQHSSKWEEYCSLSVQEKESYFSTRLTAEMVNMRSFVQPEPNAKSTSSAKTKLLFTIDREVVEKVIGDLLFDPEAEDPESEPGKARTNALKIFQQTSTDECTAKTNSALKMNLIIKFVSIGVSFQQASKLYRSFKEETGMGVLGNITDTEVAQLCRIVCAVNLQTIKELCKKIWAFSIGLDDGNNDGTAYLDVRMRFYLQGDLHNFHLIAIPMRERHTGEYKFDLVVKLLDVIAPRWRQQLIGVSSDGASAMTGCARGVVSRLGRESTASIFRIWCGTHQLDLVMKKAFSNLCEDTFVQVLTSLTGHLRRQHNLIAEMKGMCPTFTETRWISMGKLLKWLKEKRIQLFQHFDEKKPACTPPTYWWIVVYVIESLVERVEQTFKQVQGLNTLVCEQRTLFTKLARDLIIRTNVEGPLNHKQQLEAAVVHEGGNKTFIQDSFAMSWENAVQAIEECGSFVVEAMDQLKTNNQPAYEIVVTTFANFALDSICGITKIVAERDMENGAAEELPPVLPLELCSLTSRQFAPFLNKQRPRLRGSLSEQQIEQIDAQFCKLKLSYREQSFVKDELDAYSAVQSFKECWSPLGESADMLRLFCGGIASVMPGTSSVETDFSLINWHKDPNSKSLTDFSLESILHCTQYARLNRLFKQ